MERTGRYYYKLPENFIDMVSSGKKIVDVRLCDEKGEKLRAGDQLVFLKEPELKEGIRTVIKDLAYFKNFYEMAEEISPVVFGLGNLEKQEVAEFYTKFHLRSHIEKYGVVVIQFEVINQ